MSNYNNLRAEISRAIKENGNQEITGDLLQSKLIEMIDSLGEGYSFKGIATPNGEPISTDANVFYIANEVGQYPYYGGLVVADGEIAILCYNGKWEKMAIVGIVTDNKLSETVSTINTTIRDATEELNENIKKLATDLHDNYRTKEELENVLGFETLSRVAGYSYVGMVNEETAKVVDIDGTSKVYYIVVAPIDYEVLFSGAKSEAKGYTYVKSVEGQWVVEDLGIPFDLQGSLDELNREDASLETKIRQVENTAKSKVAKQQSAGQGNVVMFGEGGEVADSNIEASNVAKQNGYYESMIVGASKNLAGSDVVTAKYTYRPTAGTADVADGVAKISSVKGNTIVWNQKLKYTNKLFEQNGITAITQDNRIIINGISSSRVNILNLFNYLTFKKHKYALITNLPLSVNNIGIFVDYIGIQYSNCIVDFSQKEIADGEVKVSIFPEVQCDNIKGYINFFDLTQMFGEGKEPTIEEFEAMFPNDYYEYNEGELRSIEDFQIKSVGFNQWDEEWELGIYINGNGNGNPKATTNNIRSKNFIRVIPNSNYYFNIPSTGGSYMGYCMYYDSSKAFVKSMPIGPDYHSTKLIPNNVHYIRFYIREEYGAIYKNDISINLSHSGIRDGEYEPYQEDILPINISTIKDENGEQLFPNGLCSAGEAHDELVYDKGIGKWKAVKRIGSVDLGSLNWYTSWYANEGRIYADIISKAVGAMNIIYPLGITVANDNKLINSVGICGNATNTFIFIGQGATHTDSAAFIASLNGIYAYYELAEPIEVVLDDFTSNYQVSDWGTEEILMNSTPIVPVIYDVEYALNAVDTLRNMPTNYISKESLDAFLSALGTAMGGTWTTTYNESNNRYDFSFSTNTSTTELIEE